MYHHKKSMYNSILNGGSYKKKSVGSIYAQAGLEKITERMKSIWSYTKRTMSSIWILFYYLVKRLYYFILVFLNVESLEKEWNGILIQYTFLYYNLTLNTFINHIVKSPKFE